MDNPNEVNGVYIKKISKFTLALIIVGVILVIVAAAFFLWPTPDGPSDEAQPLVTIDQMNAAITSAVAEVKKEFSEKLAGLETKLNQLTAPPTTTPTETTTEP